MKTSHTPGPWVFAYGSVYRADTLHDESSIRIALMDRNEPHTMPTERDSNATLIATAPELLEACKELLAQQVCPLGQSKADRWSVACDLARAAISKAEGNA